VVEAVAGVVAEEAYLTLLVVEAAGVAEVAAEEA
jgi:hypothetical protein